MCIYAYVDGKRERGGERTGSSGKEWKILQCEIQSVETPERAELLPSPPLYV